MVGEQHAREGGGARRAGSGERACGVRGVRRGRGEKEQRVRRAEAVAVVGALRGEGIEFAPGHNNVW